MKRPSSPLLFRRSRTVALAGLLAVAGVAGGGCASSGSAPADGSKTGSAGASSSGTEKFCGRRSDVDCDPRNRDGHCTTK